jgi:hypothetical protein
VADGVVERLGGLPGKRASGCVGDGAGDHHRQPRAPLLEYVVDGEQGRLGVQRVEDGLHQHEVHAAFEQSVQGLGVGRDQLFEAHGAEARIVHVGRERGGLVGRAEHSGDEARPARLARQVLAHRAHRQLGGRAVQLPRQAFHAVVGHGDGGGIEGVGLDDVGAGSQILRVDVAHQRRLRQREQVVVAAQLALPAAEALAAIVLLGQAGALDHGAHGAVEQEDSSGEELFEHGPESRKARSACAETGPVESARLSGSLPTATRGVNHACL